MNEFLFLNVNMFARVADGLCVRVCGLGEGMSEGEGMEGYRRARMHSFV